MIRSRRSVFNEKNSYTLLSLSFFSRKSNISLFNILHLFFASLAETLMIDRAQYALESRGPYIPIVRATLNTAGQISFHVYTGRIQRRQQLSSNWIRSVYTLRYSAKQVALLLKCYSIVVSAECAHWLQYSYRTLKTIVMYLYQLRAIVRSERPDQRERITAEVLKVKTLHGNVMFHLSDVAICIGRSVLYRMLHLAPCVTRHIYVFMFTCILHRGTRILLHCIISTHLITILYESGQLLSPFISLQLLSLLVFTNRFASSSFNSHGE